MLILLALNGGNIPELSNRTGTVGKIDKRDRWGIAIHISKSNSNFAYNGKEIE